MCTLIALHRCIPGVPLVVAANRDEFSDRPAEGPALRSTSFGAVLAPLDLRGGGTWLGLNASGLFAAVTNRRGGDPDPERRSRGRLVVDVLGAASVDEAAERMKKLETGAYNPFNLFLADGRNAHAVTYDEHPRPIELGAGVHVIGNVDPTTAAAKTTRLKRKAEAAAEGPAETLLDRLAEICRGHDGGGDPLQDACVHAGDYGTRSSALLWLAEAEKESAFRFADGPPCTREYCDFTPLLRELGHSSRLVKGESAMRKVS
jgi:uncharacterized protein with NRDE domain